jgi:hypothetical protein
MARKRTIPITLDFTPEQIEALYDHLIENHPEIARRIAGKKLIKILHDLNLPPFPEEVMEKDVEDALDAVRGRK